MSFMHDFFVMTGLFIVTELHIFVQCEHLENQRSHCWWSLFCCICSLLSATFSIMKLVFHICIHFSLPDSVFFCCHTP